MSDPFRITGPAIISFSGGRTSGYMLWRILQAHGGTLPEDVIVTFANTGKEREETLRFVHDCGTHWNVPIVWLEYTGPKAFDVCIRGGSDMSADLMTQFEEEVKRMSRPLKIDGLDAAIIGVVDLVDLSQAIVYDREKIVRIYIREGMTREEAQEYIDFNIAGAMLGPGTPLLLDRMTRAQFKDWERSLEDDDNPNP